MYGINIRGIKIEIDGILIQKVSDIEQQWRYHGHLGFHRDQP
jgi:hypothetical protein